MITTTESIHMQTDDTNGRRTRAWMDEEYVYVDGYKLVYSIREGEMLVQLPGGVSMTVYKLTQQGHKIKMPKILRQSDFA
jgi:hypothetical protein